ncbi:uncharacterized protein MAL8P1.12 isoform X2 [Halyomorpha halys]|uniref:uncharacterized protein MAL8P1.12 isoform X2 n=1 Tax=Halyomorpha halys TaxID=286706 RepID=UPI0006D5065F|nr:uncharacterized protein LOC106691391 isoform X2 [Halyomorpha halys]
MEHCTDNYELLALNQSETTTDESELENLSRRRQAQRKRRSRTPINQGLISSSSSTYDLVFKCCWHILCLFFVGNLLWVFGLTWIGTQLKTDVQVLRNITERVSAGSDVIPESIQKCHSLTRQLEKNQTKIYNQLQRVAQMLTNFSTVIVGMQTNLTKVERKLDKSPSPQLVPDMLESVGVTIAAFKAEILDMQSKHSDIVNEHSKIKKMIDVLSGNVSLFNNDLQDFKKNSTVLSLSDQSGKDDFVKLIMGKIKPTIQLVNSTIFSRVKRLSDDLQKAQKTISNLTDESENLKSLINTTLRDLKVQSREIKAHTKEWEELMLVTKAIESNITKLVTSCSQCKSIHNEDALTTTPAGLSSSDMSNLSTNKVSDIPV